MKFRALRADEIECRVGKANADGFSLLLYKDARCDMNILDESGAMWTRRHYECKGNLFCEVGIWDDALKQFIYRSDCGTESNTEKEKGEASDSFKRACVNWGIGRELYTTPFIWIKGNVTEIERNGRKSYVPTFKTMDVIDIGYDSEGKRIAKLRIIGDGEVIFEYGYGRKSAEQDAGKTDEPKRAAKPQETAQDASRAMTLEQAWERKTTKGTRYVELSDEQLEFIIKSEKSAAESKAAAKLVLDDRRGYFDDLLPIDDGDLPF